MRVLGTTSIVVATVTRGVRYYTMKRSTHINTSFFVAVTAGGGVGGGSISGLYSPTRHREFNFGGRYRSGERVRVPDTRHIHRAAAWKITARPESSAVTAA